STKNETTPISIKDIQEIIDNKTAIISYVINDTCIYTFTLTKTNLSIETIPIKNLPELVNYYRYGLIYTNSTRFANYYKDYSFTLYDQLFPKTLKKSVKDLIIIPDGELSFIPFETLLTEKSSDQNWKELPYLIKDYNISYSYSANLYYKTFLKSLLPRLKKGELPEVTDLNDWLAIAPVFNDEITASLTLRTRELLHQLDTISGDTTGTRGTLITGEYVSPLPGTENEVRAIFDQYDQIGKKALVQINNNANEKFIKSGELEKYRFLHFATHGFVNTLKPELSGILLAQDSTINEDGILYSGEIYNLKLNSDLTVLSACETGLGKIKKGEGLIGLTRALLYAGSKNIIVSLWKVADNSTSDLMIDFYKNLLEAKQEKQEFSQALRQAKLKMIDEGKYAHPFYWSPFILIGK
ncbi:MAG: CHAT domain-containing protein, partial [Bacteroidales bacterium]|nr:CHAT domain-containing protein [Bacteroidales bacterium]